MSETIFSSVTDSLTYELLNAPIKPYPFPHFYVENVFPLKFYEEIRQHLPEDPMFQPIEDTGRYKAKGKEKCDRFVIPLDRKLDLMTTHLRPFWKSFTEILNGEQFSNALLGKFHTLVQDRFKSEVGKVRFTNDILLVRDHSKYYLPPHSDAPHRVLVLVIYLPETREHPELGTSVYIPKDPSFHCRGGPTHEFDQFNRVYTAPYLPNSAFGFFKTTNSFHGVEPLANKKLSRDLIHFFIRH